MRGPPRRFVDDLNNKFHRKKYTFLALLILFSSSFISLIPTTSAFNGEGDMSIKFVSSPGMGITYGLTEAIPVIITTENLDSAAMNQMRYVEWHICEGDQVQYNCDNLTSGTGGTGYVFAVSPDTERDVTFSDVTFTPSINGTHTVVGKFTESDQNIPNDILATTFEVVNTLIEFKVNESYDVRPIDENLANYQNSVIYNTDENYSMTLKGGVLNWESGKVATIGWTLRDTQGNKIKESMTNTSDFTDSTSYVAFEVDLPPLNSQLEGTFWMEYGLMNNSQDYNEYDNLGQTIVIFDDSVDISIIGITPKYEPESVDYHIGEGSINVEIINLGNHSIEDVTVLFKEMNNDALLGTVQTCSGLNLHPSETGNCTFDITTTGINNINASVDYNFTEGTDHKLENNYLQQEVNIITGEIEGGIISSPQTDMYTVEQIVTFYAVVNQTTPRPISYKWTKDNWIEAEANTYAINTTIEGVGNHSISLEIEDGLGRIQVINTNFKIYNFTRLDSAPYISGIAPTLREAVFNFQQSTVSKNMEYNSDEDMTPLTMFKIELEPLNSIHESEETAWIEATLNLDSLIPNNANREMIQLHRIDNFSDNNLKPLLSTDVFEVNDNSNASLYLLEDGYFVISSYLPPADVSITELSVNQGSGGTMGISWTPEGELDSEWFGGWKLYRNTLAPFPELTFDDANLWEQITRGKFVENLSYDANIWQDSLKLSNEECVSYMLIAYDRQGKVDWTRGAVTRDINNTANLVCGDSEAPEVEVIDLSSKVSYDNSTNCFERTGHWDRCYTVELSWEWPESDSDAHRYNLYRIEIRPTDFGGNIAFATPAVADMVPSPGQQEIWEDTGDGINGIRPERVYYYIITPIDDVGNLQQNTLDNNWIEVKIKDEFWDYHPDLIPEPEPEPVPPYGVQYLLTVEEYLDDEPFVITSIVGISVIALNFILLPLMIKRYKRTKKRATRRKPAYDDDDDGLDDFFN